MWKVRRHLVRAALLLAVLGAAGSQADAQVNLNCSVVIDYVQFAQDGTVMATEPYEARFTAEPGVPFVDDFSTPTRSKVFSATTELRAGRSIVTIDYFNDVGTFNSVDFNTQLTIGLRQRAESVSGSQTFSTSMDPLSGHYTTTYTLTCHR